MKCGKKLEDCRRVSKKDAIENLVVGENFLSERYKYKEKYKERSMEREKKKREI